PHSVRTAKLDLRLTPEAKRTLQEAATVAGRSVSQFVLESAMLQAEETLADRTRFVLNAAQWEAFLAVLDAPPRDLARLKRLFQGLARHPVPILLLARMAVRTAWQGLGIGAALLKDAMRRTLQAADIAGIRALAVHAKDESARSFCEHFGFIPSPSSPLHLFI